MSNKQQNDDGGTKEYVSQMIPFAIFQDDHGNLFTVSNTVVIRADCTPNAFPAYNYIGNVLFISIN